MNRTNVFQISIIGVLTLFGSQAFSSSLSLDLATEKRCYNVGEFDLFEGELERFEDINEALKSSEWDKSVNLSESASYSIMYEHLAVPGRAQVGGFFVVF